MRSWKEVIERMLGNETPSFIRPLTCSLTDADVTVMLDVPGLKVDDVTIELQDDVLTISGERAFPHFEEADDDRRDVWRRFERGYGRFERVLRVPPGLHPDSITASMADGVLTLVLPRPHDRRPRRIETASGGPAVIVGTAGERELAGATT